MPCHLTQSVSVVPVGLDKAGNFGDWLSASRQAGDGMACVSEGVDQLAAELAIAAQNEYLHDRHYAKPIRGLASSYCL
ncbi:hypothetical protein GCM10009670_22650 [Citricoccus alkalitolerans]